MVWDDQMSAKKTSSQLTVCIWWLFWANLGLFLSISILDLLNPSLRFKVDKERPEHISSEQKWVLSKFFNTKSLRNLNIYMYI